MGDQHYLKACLTNSGLFKVIAIQNKLYFLELADLCKQLVFLFVELLLRIRTFPLCAMILKEYCHAAHSQTQNKGFLSGEDQHPIFIWGTKWRPREINQSLSLIHWHSYNWLLKVKIMYWLKSYYLELNKLNTKLNRKILDSALWK